MESTRCSLQASLLFFAALALTLGLSPKISAGDRLHLRTGDVDLTNASQATNALTLPHFAATADEEEQTRHLRKPLWIGTKEKRPKVKADAKKIRHFVVQMSEPVSKEDLANFKSLKLTIIRYIPDDAVVIAGTARTAQVLAKSSNRIRAIALYRPEWKLSPDLGVSSIFSGDPDVISIIRLFPGQDFKDVSRRLKDSKVKVTGATGRTLVVESKRSLLQALASLDPIEWIEPAPLIEEQWLREDALRSYVKPSTGDYSDLDGYESGTKLMKFDSVWARGLSGEGQAVAGAIGGDGAASGGKIRGGAFAAIETPQSIWNPHLENVRAPAKLKDMFSKSYEAGVRVHTNSWGATTTLGVYDSLAQQVDEFAYSNQDFLILIAAGNNGEDADRDGRIDGGSVSTPGTAKNALTVGSSKNLVSTGGVQAKMMELSQGRDKWSVEPIASSKLSDNAKGIAAFSGRGPTRDGRLKPEIVAPGTNILSPRSRQTSADVLWGAYNDDYIWSGGTSVSTPLAAGAAAVVREYLVKDRKIAQPSAAMVKAVLMHTADDLFPGQFGAIGLSRGQELASLRPNMDEGYGRIDVEKATELSSSLLVDERVGLGPGDRHLYPVTLAKATELSATLVYSDAPGAVAASRVLVNDLDLAVVDSSGKRYELSDRTNNNEHLAIALTAGTYQIEVRGVNVPLSRQSYALVVSAK